jgi:hypothetical protein
VIGNKKMCLLNRTASGLNNLKSEAVRLKNNPMKLIKTILLAACVLTMWLAAPQSHAQGTTAFTYQGQLHDNGTNANGTYTMIFKLYDSSSGGTQIGSGITNSATLANGLFTATLDFGNVFNGAARYLDITVSNGVAQTLSPRVQVLADPYAQFAAASVTNGAIMNAQLAGNAVNATNIASSQIVKSLNNLKDAVILSPGTNVTFTTNGNTLQISSSGGGSGGGVTVTNTLAAGNNVGLFTNSGIVQISSFVPHIQLFTSGGTFTVPTNVTRIMVEMWGAGGGGGNGYDVTNSNGSGNSDGGNADAYSGGGGGAGAYAWNVFTVTAGTVYLVTNGVAGNAAQAGTGSSFGTLISASGGSAGGNASGSGSGGGGSGGQTTTGSLHNVEGGDGQDGDNNGGGGNGGGVWRGGSGNSDGPGAGGQGGGPGSLNNPSPGESGSTGVVIVYY